MSFLKIITKPYIEVIKDLLEGKEVSSREIEDALEEIAGEKLEEVVRKFREEIEKEGEEKEKLPIIMIKPEETPSILVGLAVLGLIIYLVMRR